MKKYLSIMGLFITLLVMGLKLSYLTIEAAKYYIWFLPLFFMLVLFLLFSFGHKFIKLIKQDANNLKYEDEHLTFLVILSGALSVYFFGNEYGIDKNITVGLVAIIFGVLLKKYGKEATLGAFIGAGLFTEISYLGIILISFIATIINFLFKEIFNGSGGKLGTTAFIAGLIIFLLFKEDLGDGISYNESSLLPFIIVSLVAVILTFVLNNELKLGPVIAYGIVILIGSTFLLFDSLKELNLNSLVYGSALIGMSSKEEGNSYKVVVLASIIFSFFTLVGISFLNVGGRAGLLSLISVLISKGVCHLCVKLFPNIKKDINLPLQIC